MVGKERLHEIFRFLVTGGLNTVFSYTLYFLFKLFLPYGIAFTLCYIGGILFSYTIQSKWVFRSSMSWKTFIVYPSVYLVQYLVSMLVLLGLVERAGISENWAPLFVIVATLPITYLMSRFILKPALRETP